MSSKLFVIFLVCLGILAGSAMIASAGSRPPVVTGPQAEQRSGIPGTGQFASPLVPVGGGFTYQGRLTTSGNPANGQFDLRFTLYDAATAGNQVGSPVTVISHTVSGGLFAVQLDFGSSPFQGSARWMEIEVRQTGGGAFTTLSPRLLLTAVPYAMSMIPGASITGTLDTALLSVRNEGTGAAIYADGATTGVYGTSLSLGGGIGVLGSASGGNAKGVYGTSSNGTGVEGSGFVAGVYGISSSGRGVHGVATGTDQTGVFGEANTGSNATGVHGISSGYGVVGYSSGADRAGVIGDAHTGSNAKGVYGVSSSGYGVYGSGYYTGVYGISITDAGTGVQGFSSSGYGVSGISSNGNGIQGSGYYTGVYGISSGGFGYGVRGSSFTGIGVYGSSDMGDGVKGSSSGLFSAGVLGTNATGDGVQGSSSSGTGVHGISNTGYGLHGQSTNSVGVYGSSTNLSAVYGISSSGRGVHGVATGTDQTGVFGEANTGSNASGVSGTSSNGTGVEGSGFVAGVNGTGMFFSSIGVRGTSNGGFGVYGSSNSGTGVYGLSNATTNGIGVIGEANNAAGSIGVDARSNNGTGVYARGGTWAGYFQGNVHVTGNLSKGGGSFKIDHPLDPANKYLYHSFVESPDMMNIYNGNVTTDANGEANVTMPPWFETLNRDFRYQLTVIGQFAQAIVSSEMKGNRFTIKTDKPNVKVSWQVTGIRHDPYAEQHRIPVEQDKRADERGYYLHPELYGQPKTMSVDRNYREQVNKSEVTVPSGK